jgi:hypothetical protein
VVRCGVRRNSALPRQASSLFSRLGSARTRCCTVFLAGTLGEAVVFFLCLPRLQWCAWCWCRPNLLPLCPDLLLFRHLVCFFSVLRFSFPPTTTSRWNWPQIRLCYELVDARVSVYLLKVLFWSLIWVVVVVWLGSLLMDLGFDMNHSFVWVN